MAANLTPMVMMAGQGIMDNTALAVNSTLTSLISSYSNQFFITNFNQVISYLTADLYDVSLNPNGVQQATIDALIGLFTPQTALLINRIPSSITGTGATYFTTYLQNQINSLFSVSDIGLYCVRLQVASGFAELMNQYVNSAVNGASLASSTFTSMDALSTGNIALVNTDTANFGLDLQNSGSLYNFANLSTISTPQGIADALARTNQLVSVASELAAQGIDAFDLQTALQSNSGSVMKPLAQKRLYDAFSTVTGKPLADILTVMNFTTSSITYLTDLLDLTKVFPNSYTTMQTLNNGAATLVFTGTNPSTYVLTLTSDLATAMPSAQASVSEAFQIALGQIKGITNTTPAKLGAQATAIERMSTLSTISALTSALPADTVTHYQNQVGGGSGPDGTFFVSDIVGTPAGIPHNDNLPTVISFMTGTFNVSSQYTAMNDIFNIMVQVVTGGGANVTIVPSPYSVTITGTYSPGTYGSDDSAIQALSTNINSQLSAFITANSAALTTAETAYENSINHILSEQSTVTKMQFTLTASNTQQILGFAGNLPTYGKKTDKGNIVEILDGLVAQTRGGDAILGAMREGRNADKFRTAGIQADNKIDDSPKIVIPGNIS